MSSSGFAARAQGAADRASNANINTGSGNPNGRTGGQNDGVADIGPGSGRSVDASRK